ncbi:MAG: DsrE family protein [Gammaproteobacteria bacterium]|jgi:hypothetical protein
MKTAILVLSDPAAGTEEALGRVFNALAVAYDCKHNGDAVSVIFMGAGTRWVKELDDPDNPAHELFDAVRDTVAGASCGCADVFGAAQDIRQSEFPFVSDNNIPGTSGLPGIRRLLANGYSVLAF